MSLSFDRAGFTTRMCRSLAIRAAPPGAESLDGMRLLQLMAGLLVETLLLFEDPDEGLAAAFTRLQGDIPVSSHTHLISDNALPPPWVIDYETEQGRILARDLFEEWLDCGYEFHEMVVLSIQHLLHTLEESGQPKTETLTLFRECALRCLAWEMTAQELCDVVIERKIGRGGWSMGDSISGLSAVSGRYLALSQDIADVLFPDPPHELPELLDEVSYVMTQEAVRGGVPAGTDWRFGLPANDTPANAPHDLIGALSPVCDSLFDTISLPMLADRAVGCAKAAGRMVAVASGGELPSIEPVIAKPLAMAAMTETYRTLSQTEAVVAG